MPSLPDEMYCSEQINIPPSFPYLLRQYAKAAIRTQPIDLLKWSTAYFRCLSLNIPPPVKPRLEYPIPRDFNGITPGWLKALLYQLQNNQTVPFKILWDRWIGACLEHHTLIKLLCLGGFDDANAIPWLRFVAICAGTLTDDLTHTMILICEILTEEPEGGSAMISLEIFMDLYKFLAKIDASKDQELKNFWFRDSLLSLWREKVEKEEEVEEIHEVTVVESDQSEASKTSSESVEKLDEQDDMDKVVSCPSLPEDDQYSIGKSGIEENGTEKSNVTALHSFNLLVTLFELITYNDTFRILILISQAMERSEVLCLEKSTGVLKLDYLMKQEPPDMELEGEGAEEAGEAEPKEWGEEEEPIEPEQEEQEVKVVEGDEEGKGEEEKIEENQPEVANEDKKPDNEAVMEDSTEKPVAVEVSQPEDEGKVPEEEESPPAEEIPLDDAVEDVDENRIPDVEHVFDEEDATLNEDLERLRALQQEMQGETDEELEKFKCRLIEEMPLTGSQEEGIKHFTIQESDHFTSDEKLKVIGEEKIHSGEISSESQEGDEDKRPYDTVFCEAIPGIGGVVPDQLIVAVEEYMKNCARIQHGVVMPRNIRHYSCPPLESMSY